MSGSIEYSHLHYNRLYCKCGRCGKSGFVEALPTPVNHHSNEYVCIPGVGILCKSCNSQFNAAFSKFIDEFMQSASTCR